MLAYPIATAALLIGTASAAASSANPQLKTDFMRAMDTRKNKRRRRLSHKEFQTELHGDSKTSAALRKKMIQKSTVVKSPGSGEDRKLQNNNNYNNYNSNANANANANANRADGSDDYFNAYGEWDNTFGFDPTQYSLSYHRCAAVRQFDEELAAEEGSMSVLATKRFAVFRFCPEATCVGWEEEESDCGCQDQCDAIKEANGNGNGDDDNADDQCETACQEQCDIWQQQYSMYGNYEQTEGGGNRKLQSYYNGSNNNAYSSYTFNPNYLEDNQEIFGARGEGCQSNYGEYMIEMTDYLKMMLEWQEERFETYCEYCEECMMAVYEEWMNQCMQNGCTNRDLKYQDWKGSEHEDKFNKERELGGYDYSNFYDSCPEYDTCVEYKQTCKNGVVDDYSDYFECTEVENSNGQVAYVGPHCSQDGFEITLGVYSDQYCNEYIGSSVNIASFLGGKLEEDALMQYYNSAFGPTLSQLQYVQEENVCIPCRKGDQMWEGEVGEYNNVNTDDDTDDDRTDINYDSTEVSELCENLYKVSARCDKHFRAYSNKSSQAKYAEAVAQEDLSCDFIDSIVMGNYDENGIINLRNNGGNTQQTGWMANTIYGQQYAQYVSEVTPLQIFGLVASIMAVAVLALWSMTLHKSTTKQGPWRPRRGLNAGGPEKANDLNRESSGIVMGRSASNTSYYVS
mmetsp:Transcript_26313/g.56516  ORF Transcript_26313/g.56516 Transcript_26313/m.56516 type:complete len:684 (+) Transcript_26313:42-2093(+)